MHRRKTIPGHALTTRQTAAAYTNYRNKLKIETQLLKEDDSRPDQINGDVTSWGESPWLIMKGFLMGSADIVPGVSGGTMALITGVYNRLIFAIKSVDSTTIRNTLTLRFKKVFEHFHWKFLLLLFTGMILAVIFFTRIVPLQVYMFTHPEIVYGLFFGLILGSIFLLLGEVKKINRNWKGLLSLSAGALFGFWIVTLVPADTPETFWFVFLSGAVSICAMILPGVSGSYILLILRKYDYILSQLGQIGSVDTVGALINLLPFVLGALVGLASFARLLSWLLRNYYAVTILILIGFLVGSLYVIWPWQDRVFDESVRNVEVLPMSNPLVQELMNQEHEQEGPRFKRIGRVINADAAFEQFRRVEVETVSRRMVSSKPYFPAGDSAAEKEADRLSGAAGITAGLLLIGAISFLRRKGVTGEQAVHDISGK